MWFIRLRKKLFELIRFSLSGAKNKCLILGTPAHKNLGDHAIVYAQYKFIQDVFENCSILELSRLEYETYKKVIRFITPVKTLIVVDGGGNLGSLWPVEDECIRDIVGRFNNNPVMVFPQTAFYEDSEAGMDLLEKTAKLINGRNQILFMFRDEKSYAMFSDKVDKAKIMLCPDIVTYVDDAAIENSGSLTDNVGICFRDDKENVMSEDDRNRIVKYIEASGRKVVPLSTISQKNIHAPERNEALKKKWKEFSECELIITDRLHGMIFSAVTGTKCIAFDNVSKKVNGGYKWLEELEYIQYCEGYDGFEKKYDELIRKENTGYKRAKVVQNFFEPARDFISKLI